MVINGQALLVHAPIKDMLPNKLRDRLGVSYGLAEVGYDIRLKQEIVFYPGHLAFGGQPCIHIDGVLSSHGSFTIASAIEEFDMPDNLVGVVHDKSTWARRGLEAIRGALAALAAHMGIARFAIHAAHA